MDVDIDIDTLDTFTGTFTGPLTRLRARSTAPVVSSTPTPSYRLITTLVPIYTSASAQSVPTPVLPTESVIDLPLLQTSTATPTLEPVSIAPLASLYFPAATHPHWVPSDDDVPGAWRPHVEQDEMIVWISFVAVAVGIFLMGIVGVLVGVNVWSCWKACSRDEKPGQRAHKRREDEEIKEQERAMEKKEGKRAVRWFT